MTQFWIGLYDPPGLPGSELLAAAEAGWAVISEAKAAGVWVLGGGLMDPRESAVVAIDGTATDGPMFPDSGVLLGGFTVVDVPTREDAVRWAAKIAAASRCPQEVREFLGESEVPDD